MSNIDRNRLENYFRLKDKNGDGYLDTTEIRVLLNEICAKYPGTHMNIDEFLQKYDRDGNRRISLNEFLRGFNDDHKPAPIHNEMRDTLICTFKRIDVDNSGSLSYSEFKNALSEAGRVHNKYFSDDVIKAYFRYYDINGDGKIDISEFLRVSIV